MEVASKELCEELYRLSGLEDTHAWYTGERLFWKDMSNYGDESIVFANDEYNNDIPAYSLGYLIRKMPNNEEYRSDLVKFKDEWEAYLWGPTPFSSFGSTNLIVLARGINKSPENAVCSLLIEMFRQGILKRED